MLWHFAERLACMLWAPQSARFARACARVAASCPGPCSPTEPHPPISSAASNAPSPPGMPTAPPTEFWRYTGACSAPLPRRPSPATGARGRSDVRLRRIGPALPRGREHEVGSAAVRGGSSTRLKTTMKRTTPVVLRGGAVYFLLSRRQLVMKKIGDSGLAMSGARPPCCCCSRFLVDVKKMMRPYSS